MITKPNILVFIDWFWPGYLAGGPVQSILSLVNYLGGDFNFKIVTTNRDLNSNIPYPGIEPDKWIRSSLGCEIYYANPQNLNYGTLKKIIAGVSFEKVYINSFFSKNFSILPLGILNKYHKEKPVILAPRGMLGDGALAIKKFKKQLFILYSKASGLHARVTWHATSEQEVKEIKKVIAPGTPVVKISNLPKKLSPNRSKSKKAGELHLCFISRISEKKNLVFALNILARIKDQKIRYNIYGPLEDKLYWEKCESIIKKLPETITVTYKGSTDPGNIEKVLAGEQVMFLPTFNENFGHSIVESLLCGCPAIISDQTPWNDLEANHAGYAIALNEENKFIEAIEHCAGLDQDAFSHMSEQAINYISKRIDLDLITRQYKILFDEPIKN